MMVEFIRYKKEEDKMVRRTISMTGSTEALIKRSAEEGESFSATVARLVEAGAQADGGKITPGYVASGEGPGDLGINNELYLSGILPLK